MVVRKTDADLAAFEQTNSIRLERDPETVSHDEKTEISDATKVALLFVFFGLLVDHVRPFFH